MLEPPEANLPLPRLALVQVEPRSAGSRWTLQRLRSLSVRDPRGWMGAAAAAAWVFIAAAPRAHAGSAQPMQAHVLGLAAMVIAMMLPLAVGRLPDLARSGPWGRRHRAAAGFLAGYLPMWMLAILLIDLAWTRTASLTGRTSAAVIAMAAAAVWEFVFATRREGSPHVETPLTTREWRGDADCAKLGMIAAGSCVASCWALMAACVAFAHDLPVMVALFCVQMNGRHGKPASPAVTALAVLGVCAASLVFRMSSHHAM